MPITRRKVSAVLNDFHQEIERLERYDRENQQKFSCSVSSPDKVRISRHQLHMLTESIFSRGFVAYENFLRDTFLLYCMHKPTTNNIKVNSYVNPRDFLHAEKLVQSSMNYLDWSSPDILVERAELYLAEGYPFKGAITSNLNLLKDYKHIRNHIAHNSKESYTNYLKALRHQFTTMPLVIPCPGEFLLTPEKGLPHKYKLLTFFEVMIKVAGDLT